MFPVHFGSARLLSAVVTWGEPTLSSYKMHDVIVPSGHSGGHKWQIHGETMYYPPCFSTFFLVRKRTVRMFGEAFVLDVLDTSQTPLM